MLVTPDELWALRYPDVHELHVLEREPGGTSGSRHLEHASARGSIRVRSGDLAALPAVVVASERMDEDPGWRALRRASCCTSTGSCARRSPRCCPTHRPIS